jgi:hypothetical protein
MIDDDVEGVDKYTLNGSTWLIFTYPNGGGNILSLFF